MDCTVAVKTLQLDPTTEKTPKALEDMCHERSDEENIFAKGC